MRTDVRIGKRWWVKEGFLDCNFSSFYWSCEGRARGHRLTEKGDMQGGMRKWRNWKEAWRRKHLKFSLFDALENEWPDWRKTVAVYWVCRLGDFWSHPHVDLWTWYNYIHSVDSNRHGTILFTLRACIDIGCHLVIPTLADQDPRLFRLRSLFIVIYGCIVFHGFGGARLMRFRAT